MPGAMPLPPDAGAILPAKLIGPPPVPQRPELWSADLLPAPGQQARWKAPRAAILCLGAAVLLGGCFSWSLYQVSRALPPVAPYDGAP